MVKCSIAIITDVVGDDVEQLKLSYTAGKSINWGSHFGDDLVFSTNAVHLHTP